MESITRLYAKKLRRNQTEAEQKLWRFLRSDRFDGFKFKRQMPIGPFIADFCCLRGGLIVELDGSQHLENMQKDLTRNKYLESEGFCVLRFWNHDVLHRTEQVLEEIRRALSVPSPQPSPEKGEGGSYA